MVKRLKPDSEVKVRKRPRQRFLHSKKFAHFHIFTMAFVTHFECHHHYRYYNYTQQHQGDGTTTSSSIWLWV